MNDNQDGAMMSDEPASFAELRWKTIAGRLFVNHAVVCLSCLPELDARNRQARGYIGVVPA